MQRSIDINNIQHIPSSNIDSTVNDQNHINRDLFNDNTATIESDDVVTPVEHIEEQQFSQLFFAAQNINGLTTDITKLQHLLVYTASMDIDIVVVTETNINNKNGKFIKIHDLGYRSFWSDKDQKIKGS